MTERMTPAEREAMEYQQARARERQEVRDELQKVDQALWRGVDKATEIFTHGGHEPLLPGSPIWNCMS